MLISMTSWRPTTSQNAQDDVDGLFGAVLPFAEQTLGRFGELYPFGASLTTDGQVTILGGAPGLGEHPDSLAVLEVLYRGAADRAAGSRAFAFVADVRANGGDAVRVEVEHREGVALVLLIPYTRSRLRKTVTLGQMSVSAASRRIWSA
jgi:hypothetical protein